MILISTNNNDNLKILYSKGSSNIIWRFGRCSNR